MSRQNTEQMRAAGYASHRAPPSQRGTAHKDALNQLATRLLSVVAEEAEHYEHLLSLLEQQEQHLFAGDTARLNGNTRELEHSVKLSHQLGRRRLELVHRLARALPNGDPRADLGCLLATVSENYGHCFDQMRRSLMSSLSQLITTKEQNATLIANSLRQVRDSLHVLKPYSFPAARSTATPVVSAYLPDDDWCA